MTKIAFTAAKTADSTHRISDEAESVWFKWPRGYTVEAVQAAYQRGYDNNGSNSTTEAWIHRERDGAIICRWTF